MAGRAPTPWAQAPGRPATTAGPGPEAAPPPPSRLATAGPPAVVVGAVAAWRVATHGPSPALAVLVVVGVVTVVVAATWPARFRAVVHRAAAGLAHVVGTVAMASIWFVAVLVPGLFGRLVRSDPFEGPERRAGSRWIDRARRDVAPAHRWAPEPGLVPVARRVRRRRRLALAAVATTAALVLAGLAYVGSTTTFTPFGVLSPLVAARSVAPPFPDETPAAYEGDEWYPQHQADIAWLWTVATAWDPFSMLRIRDVRTETVNVVDGVRRSWTPPPCDDCPRLRVWLYGGSTAFGLGQRDEHTIASELARLAWADGIALDVDNRGVPGWLHWQDANRFAWDLATYDAPDAVVFYDGFNEIFGLEGLDEVGDGYAPVDPYAAVFWRTLTDDARAPDAPPGAAVLEPPTLDPDATDDRAGLIVERYDRSRRMSAASARDAEVAVDWFWQPSRWSRPAVEGEPDSGDSDQWRALDRDLRAALDDEVHDVAGALDGSDEPHFYDDAHHDEDAARLIAAAMWAELGPRYRALADAS